MPKNIGIKSNEKGKGTCLKNVGIKSNEKGNGTCLKLLE